MKKVGDWWIPDQEKHILEYFEFAKENEYQSIHQKESIRFCSRRRTAIDIGAHIGLWSKNLSKEFAKVHSFEPCHEFAELLSKNAPTVEIHPFALGASEGLIALNIEQDNTGATHILRGKEGSIPLKTLDSFDIHDVDFIKIDVEGYELEVLKGAKELLARESPVIIVEQKDKYIVPEEGPKAAVKYLINNFGFRVISKIVDDWILKKQ